MSRRQFFDRRFLWALVLTLPIVILLLNREHAARQIEAQQPESAAPDGFQLLEPAPPGPGRSFNVQELLGERLPRTLFVAAPELPIVDIRLVFDAGAARDANLPGLAGLTSGLLREGTRSHDALAVARAFESVGARFDTGSYRDMAIVELRVMSDADKLEPALDMLGEILREPAFSKDALERDRKQAIAGLKARRQHPAQVMADAWYPALYPEHAYGIPPHGTEQSLASIGQQDVAAFYRRYYNRDNVIIAMVGDLDSEQAMTIASALAAQLATGEPAPAPAAPSAPAGRVMEIEFPSAQTHVQIGTLGVSRGDADLPALIVGNEILGGSGLVSLLSQEIREQRGLAYSVHSGFSPMRVPGPFSIALQTRADQADEAQAIALQLLRDFIESGPDEAQVDKARRQLAGAFALGTASNASIAGQLGAIGFYGLPTDYLDRYLDRIRAVNRQQVIEAFRRHVDLDRLLVIRVGPRQPAGNAL